MLSAEFRSLALQRFTCVIGTVVATGLSLPVLGGEWTAVQSFSNEVVMNGSVGTPQPARPRAIPSPQLGRGPIVLASGTPDLALEERLEPSGSSLTRPMHDVFSDAPARPSTTRPSQVLESKFTIVDDNAPSPQLAPLRSSRQIVPTEENIVDDGNNVPWDDVAAYYPAEFCDGEIVTDGWCDDFTSCRPVGSIWDMGISRLGNLSINVGTTGFQNALDGGQNSNFGFSEGFNWSMPITPQQFISGQVGYRATQTNLTGTAFGRGSRNQHAMTAGFFLRNHFSRFQAGIVYDWFQDDFYSHIRMEQLRMELSVRSLGGYEFGFIGAKAVSTEHNTIPPFPTDVQETDIKPLDYYTLFIRKNLAFGGVGALSGGTTSFGGGLFGAKYEVPISDRFYINSQLLMYIPKEGRGIGGQAKESWGVGIDLVWTIGRGAMSRQCNMSRPMFDVVDSTTLIPSIR